MVMAKVIEKIIGNYNSYQLDQWEGFEGCELMDRIYEVLDLIEIHCPDVSFTDEESVCQCAKEWRESTWQKVLLANRLLRHSALCNVLEYAGFHALFDFANELNYVAPVVGAFASLNKSWDEIRYYYGGYELKDDTEDRRRREDEEMRMRVCPFQS